VGEAPVADMSVMTMPSRFQVFSALGWPLEDEVACWPFSLPAMLTRSTMTPGTARITPQGSRAFGTLLSSSLVIVVAVPRRLLSTSGVSAWTSIVSATPETFMPNSSSTFSPVVTLILRAADAKPASVRVTV
jgi:hypothetical protein